MGSLCSKGTEKPAKKGEEKVKASTEATTATPATPAPVPSDASSSSAQKTPEKKVKVKAEKKEAKKEEKKATSDDDDVPDGAEPRLTLEESTAETDALYKKHRAEADEHAKLRAKYFDEASEAHKAGDGKRSKELSDKGKEEGRLMEEAGLRAARAIFEGKNKKQPKGTIDLHGLQVKEAEMIVAEQIDLAKKGGATELKIIIGAGHHSDSKGPKVGPAVKKLLEENGKWRPDETNASGGCIIATF